MIAALNTAVLERALCTHWLFTILSVKAKSNQIMTAMNQSRMSLEWLVFQLDFELQRWSADFTP